MREIVFLCRMERNRQGILVAACDNGLRERVARVLEANGFNVFRCADMAQAEQALHGAWVDTLVAQMPGAKDDRRSSSPKSLREALRECERQHIEQVLAFCQGNKAYAARMMGIGLSSLYRKLDEYGFLAEVP